MNWQRIIFLGDSALLLPSALLVLMMIFYSNMHRRIAWYWALLFGSTCFIVCISKLAFMGWGIGSKIIDFTGFSGHAALSACFWPVLFFLLSSRFSLGMRYIACFLGLFLALLIGYSRLQMQAHSASEVVLGLLLGIMGSLFFLLQLPPKKMVLHYGKALVLIVFMGTLLSIAKQMPTQSLLERIAITLGSLEKPYTRLDLHAGVIPPLAP